MNALSKRLSMSSLGRKSAGAGGAGGGGGGGGAAGGAEAEELAALDKTLARLAKALEKSSVRLDDKNELSEAIAPALQDAAEHAELSALLSKLSSFQSELKRMQGDLRRSLEGGALSSLRTSSSRASLRDALAAVAALTKANESCAREEKVHETRHTPESKTRLAAAQETVAERQSALAQQLAVALPQTRSGLREALAAYAQAYASFFTDGQKAGAALSAGLQSVKQSGAGAGAVGGAGGGMGVFGSSLATLLELENSTVPKFVDEAVATLESRGVGEPGLFRQAPPQATEALRAQIEGGSSGGLQRANILAVAALLKSWFTELPEPVLTFGLYDRWISAASELDSSARGSALRAVFKELPNANQSVLLRLLRLLDRVAKESRQNGLPAARLAVLWGPSLLRPKNPNPENSVDDLGLAGAVALQLIGCLSVLDTGVKSAPPRVEKAPVEEAARTKVDVQHLAPADLPPPPASAATSKPATAAKPVESIKPLPPKKVVSSVAKTSAAAPLQRGSAPEPSTAKASAATAPVAPPKKVVAGAKGGLAPKRAAPLPSTPAPSAPAKKAVSPRKASPPAARKPTAHQDDGSDELDSDDGSGGASGIGDDDEMIHMRHASSTQDVEDMQSLGILGMMLSEERRSTLSPAQDRKSANW